MAQQGIREAEVKAATTVQARHDGQMFNLDGVVGVGVGLSESGDEVAIHVYVDTSTGSPALPLDLEGVPVRVIDLPEPIMVEDGGPNHRLALPLPVPMGVSTSNVIGNFAGTLGFKVRRIGNGEVGYVTNNHIAAASGPNQLSRWDLEHPVPPHRPPEFIRL